MKKKFFLTLFILLVTVNSFVYSAKPKKNFIKKLSYTSDYSLPLSFNLSIFWSPNIFVYYPVSNYTGEFSFTLDLGLGVEYRFNKILGFENMLFINLGYHYSETKYKDNGYVCWMDPYLQMHEINLFIQLMSSFKFYF